jgi:Fe-S-cluster containining protein
MNDPCLRPYFFDAGIRFVCQQCGKCCTGDPGIIHVTVTDIQMISDYLNVSVPDIMTEFIRPYPKGLTIAETKNGNCRFYQTNDCIIYPVRPIQCRTYPFWLRTLRSESSWRNACRECPGIGSGTFYTRDEILAMVSLSLTSVADI